MSRADKPHCYITRDYHDEANVVWIGGQKPERDRKGCWYGVYAVSIYQALVPLLPIEILPPPGKGYAIYINPTTGAISYEEIEP